MKPFANAIFNATRRRIKALPITRQRIVESGREVRA